MKFDISTAQEKLEIVFDEVVNSAERRKGIRICLQIKTKIHGMIHGMH